MNVYKVKIMKTTVETTFVELPARNEEEAERMAKLAAEKNAGQIYWELEDEEFEVLWTEEYEE